VGLIGAVAEGTKSILSIFAGHWSDHCGRQRPLVIGGYTMAMLAKLGLYLSTIWQHILGLRLLDRVGKGLRIALRSLEGAE